MHVADHSSGRGIGTEGCTMSLISLACVYQENVTAHFHIQDNYLNG